LLFGENDKALIHVLLDMESKLSPKDLTEPNGPAVDYESSASSKADVIRTEPSRDADTTTLLESGSNLTHTTDAL
jgi:hypothetical protein